MVYPPKHISGPSIEPVTPADLKDDGHLRIPHDAEDTLLTGYIEAARQYVEWRTSVTLMETVWEEVADRFPSSRRLYLQRGKPLLSVTSVKYTDKDDAETTWNAANYRVNTDASTGFIEPVYGGTWPSFTPAPSAAVRVRYVAGLSASASPLIYPGKALLHPIFLLVGAMYENREAEVIPDRQQIETLSMKYGVEAYLSFGQARYAF